MLVRLEVRQVAGAQVIAGRHSLKVPMLHGDVREEPGHDLGVESVSKQPTADSIRFQRLVLCQTAGNCRLSVSSPVSEEDLLLWGGRSAEGTRWLSDTDLRPVLVRRTAEIILHPPVQGIWLATEHTGRTERRPVSRYGPDCGRQLLPFSASWPEAAWSKPSRWVTRIALERDLQPVRLHDELVLPAILEEVRAPK